MEVVVIIFILILLNGLFSMAEIAMEYARKARLEYLANKGDEKAKAALQLANNQDRFLSTVQVGITLTSIAIGLLSGIFLRATLVDIISKSPLLSPYSNGIAITIIVVVVSYVTLVLGELLPKRLGMARPEGIAKSVARPMILLSRITYPFIWLLGTSTSLLVKILNVKPSDNNLTEEEIKALITESDAIEETEQEIIERVFHLGDRNITSLMTHRTDIEWLDIHDNKEVVRKKIFDSPHSVYPVCEGQVDHIVGIIKIKDLYMAAASNNYSLNTILRKPLFVPENNSAYQVLEKFKETQSRAAFIVDEYGTFLGMITLNDILEAIVGDMPETGQEDDWEIVQREDGSYLVDAQIPFYDFLSKFDKEGWMTDFEQEFDTMAGFILHHQEHIPKVGEKFEWRGFTIEIVDMDAHRIDKVLVVAPSPEVEEG
ncbi:hemolysin family protein [Chitinophaga sancti]|uniref:Hemolysin family protein n=1 Tax=Chitinophaga sancti TaxID=1004 RepID=A0A1K1PYH2_9BACT|nr:hemolysin family protein [Chitinophaga sancti]WQD61556.1 hemolysin family protein [Chitinophaga sancti]WQG92887.1 hemolysin family protein [Chitinophaga sancti]SFW51902.1 putative hemolysin [Chitinophaga sancti]